MLSMTTHAISCYTTCKVLRGGGVWWGGYIGITLYVCPSVLISVLSHEPLKGFWWKFIWMLDIIYVIWRFTWRRIILRFFSGEIIQLRGQVRGLICLYLISATPPKLLNGFWWNFNHVKICMKEIILFQFFSRGIIQLRCLTWLDLFKRNAS